MLKKTNGHDLFAVKNRETKNAIVMPNKKRRGYSSLMPSKLSAVAQPVSARRDDCSVTIRKLDAEDGKC